MSTLDRAGVARTKRPRAIGRSLLTEAMKELPPARQAELLEELAYLVNVLLAGSERHYRPAEAAEAVVSVVESQLPDSDLEEDSLVNAFRRGVRANKLGS